jgi:hypothetical protein
VGMLRGLLGRPERPAIGQAGGAGRRQGAGCGNMGQQGRELMRVCWSTRDSRDIGLQDATVGASVRRESEMPRLSRRNFLRVAILGGLAVPARTVCAPQGKLPPTAADPAVPEGATVQITLRDGRTVCRICRGGYWVTGGPAA